MQSSQSDSKRKGLSEGTFTVVYAGTGAHRTLRLETPKDGNFAGKTILSILVGPDNEEDYKGVGFVNPFTGVVSFWSKFRAQNMENDGQRLRRIQFAVNCIFADPFKAGEAYALRSGCCFHCGRKLTVPASIHRGLGPVCSAKYGTDYEVPNAVSVPALPAPKVGRIVGEPCPVLGI